jgi:hypothetical protein
MLPRVAQWVSTALPCHSNWMSPSVLFLVRLLDYSPSLLLLARVLHFWKGRAAMTGLLRTVSPGCSLDEACHVLVAAPQPGCGSTKNPREDCASCTARSLCQIWLCRSPSRPNLAPVIRQGIQSDVLHHIRWVKLRAMMFVSVQC